MRLLTIHESGGGTRNKPRQRCIHAPFFCFGWQECPLSASARVVYKQTKQKTIEDFYLAAWEIEPAARSGTVLRALCNLTH